MKIGARQEPRPTDWKAVGCGTMELKGKKFGILIAAHPDRHNFRHGLKLAEAALGRGATVYVYCIDEAVRGLEDPLLQKLNTAGAKLYACAYSAQQRQIPISEAATFAGLAIVSDIVGSTNRFVSFN